MKYLVIAINLVYGCRKNNTCYRQTMCSFLCSFVLGLLYQVSFSGGSLPDLFSSTEELVVVKRQSISEVQSYEHFGCYNDSTHQILSVLLGDVSPASDPVEACANIVKETQYKVFGIQNGRSCWSGSASPESFYMIKRAKNCNITHGGWFFVDVYVVGAVNVPCPVGTRRDLNLYCKKRRDHDLEKSKQVYQLGPTYLNLFPSINVTIQQLKAIYKNDPVNAEWLTIYEMISRRNLVILYSFLKQTNLSEVTAVEDYKNVLKFFIESQYSPRLMPKEHSKFFRFFFVESDEPFERLSRLCNWREDRIFTDQRLAGGNPMAIQRVTIGLEGSIGVDWDYLKARLNDTYQWETAVQDAIGKDISLQEAITAGYLYVVHYPSLDDVPTRDEPSLRGRKLMKAVSPIALFASKPSRNKKTPNQLIPLAIQIGHTQDSLVATPNDGDKWLLAKQTVQVADFVYAGSVEHLLKTHLFIEPICVAMLRHFHSLHPLHQLLKFHCRGVSGTNKFNIENLTGRNSTSDLLFAIGYPGGYELLRKAFEASSWDDADFIKDIKRRGMDIKHKVPYYPYRDDGMLIYRSIKDMVSEYVRFFYRKQCQVESDPELQAFANEVSAEGRVPPDGGKGMIQGFPSSIKTRHQLIGVLTCLIWTTSAQHSAINYPSNYYGSYTLNMPTKLYRDSWVEKGTFDLLNFPDKTTSAIQAALGMNLASLRYDRLLDYGDKLQHLNATNIVKRHSRRLNGYTATVIESRNRKRYEESHLTYPYLVPGWIANSIHT